MLSGGVSEKMVHLANKEVLKISQNKLIGLPWYIKREIKDKIRNIFIKLFSIKKWEKLKELFKKCLFK